MTRRPCRSPKRAAWVTAGAVVATLLWLTATAAAQERLTRTQLGGVRIDQRLESQVPLDTAFRDETGAEVQLGRYFSERPVILALYYSDCPMLCNMVLQGLASSLKTLEGTTPGEDVEVVAVSFDPEEGPELAASQKASFLKRYDRGAGEGIHFLTGDRTAIDAVASSVGFGYAYDEKLQQYAHAAAIVVLTPQGKVSRYFFGTEYPPRDVRLALVESSEGKVGGLTDALMLLCYRYDPATGMYSATIVNVIRIGAALTFLLLAAFVLGSLRRERQERLKRASELAVEEATS